MPDTPCRRCYDCADSDHHWLENGDFGNDPGDAESPTGNAYVCKHCPAVGDSCPECGGPDEADATGDDAAMCDCPVCGGEGVVTSAPRSFESLGLFRKDAPRAR